MKKTVYICTFLSMFCMTLIHAQNMEDSPPKTSSIHVHIGAANVLMKDRSFSALNFSGTILTTTLGYEKQKKEHLLVFDLNTKYGTLTYGKYFPTDLYDLKLSGAYARKLRYKHQPLQGFLGAKVHSALRLLDYNGFDNGSWISSVGLDIFYVGEYTLNHKNTLRIDFSYPILAYAVRPPYAGFDAYVSELASDNKIPTILFTKGILTSGLKLVNPTLVLGYVYDLSDKIDISARYSFDFLHYHPSNYIRNSKVINSFTNTFLVGVNIKFKK